MSGAPERFGLHRRSHASPAGPVEIPGTHRYVITVKIEAGLKEPLTEADIAKYKQAVELLFSGSKDDGFTIVREVKVEPK